MSENTMQYFYIAKNRDELNALCNYKKNDDNVGYIMENDSDKPIITLLPGVPTPEKDDITTEWLQNKLLSTIMERLKKKFLPTPATILIHFGGQGPNQCSRLTKAMYDAAGQKPELKEYYFFAVSRENKYPPEFWNDNKLTLPANCDAQAIPELRDKVMNSSESLEHLKGIVILCCELLLCEDSVITERLTGKTDRKYWQDALWEKNDKKEFSTIEEEIIAIITSNNGKLKNFFDNLLNQTNNFDLCKNDLQLIIDSICEQIKQAEQ